ncbi:MAG: hypothetical protein K5886_10050 [Lachnospiraceae bacterium]|nr:hypothetical protein [Lachnospiraceae bacterium]
MDNKNHKRAKILTLIPLIIFAVTAACLIPLMISYFSTGSDVTAVAIILAGTLILIFTTLPCLVMSVMGTVFASKAKNEGQSESRKFFVIGIIEIIVYGFGMLITIAAELVTLIAANR